MVLCIVLTSFCVGCDDSREAETALFEAAEDDYRAGNYTEAQLGYQKFLERYPQSPLASTVETRVRNISREVSSVMETTDSPRPSYHGFDGEQSSSLPATDTIEEPEKFPPPTTDDDVE